MIVAAHTLVYSSDPVATRTFFRDVLRWPFVSDAEPTADAPPDDASGWLIFGTGPSELGVHPLVADDGRDQPRHVLSLVCDNIDATVAELAARGATFRGEPEDRRYGIAVDLVVPGGVDIQIYEPRHTVAYDLPRD